MACKRSIAFLLPLLLLAAVLTGCGRRATPESLPTDTPPAPTATATSVPADPPEPTAAPATTPTATAAPIEPAATAAISEPAQLALPSAVLNGFRTRGDLSLATTFEDGTTEEETLTLEGAYTGADNAFGFNRFFLLQATRAEAGEPQVVAIYEVDNRVAAFFENTWRTADRSEAILSMAENPFDRPLEELRQALAEAENVGAETINDAETVHYRTSDPDIFLRVSGLERAEGQEIGSAQVDVWLATQNDFVIKYSIAATVNNVVDLDETGNQIRADQRIDWNFELYDMETDITIEIPEEAPEPGAVGVPGFGEGEFPLPVGAEVKINLFGQMEIITHLSEEEAADFYEKALAQLGWTLEGEFGLYEATKNNLHFNLVTLTDDQGRTTVQVRGGD